MTGAGCSTASGIPDYRDAGGSWKRARPVMYQAYLSDPMTRRRYWARSLVGWRSFQAAEPNQAHRALARLEQQDRIELLVTQNVDRLHQAVGQRRVIDLHGRLDRVRCMECGRLSPRAAIQAEIEKRNPGWTGWEAPVAPDGDADLEGANFADFEVPDCPDCGGLLKPDVVFFGEPVPRERTEAAVAALWRADAMLVVGSSLMVYSGYRLVRAVALAGKPIAAVNIGRTRADELFALKIEAPCTDALHFVLA